MATATRQETRQRFKVFSLERLKTLDYILAPTSSSQDRVKCDSLGGEGSPQSQRSLYIKAYPPTMPRTVLKVCGGWVVGGWLRPILVFSLSLDQAEQQNMKYSKTRDTKHNKTQNSTKNKIKSKTKYNVENKTQQNTTKHKLNKT